MAFILSWSCRCFVLLPLLLLLLLLSLIRQRFTSHSACLQSIALSIGSHGTWLRGMPQRVQFIKLNMTVALCSSAVRAVVATWGRCRGSCCHAAGCCTYLLFLFLPFLPFLLFLSLSSLCSLLSAIVCMSFRIPYPVSRYAICRVPFPDLCNSMHVPHFCSKTFRKCMWCMAATKIPQKVPQTLNLKHVARCTDCSASSH